ncbi:M1 family metallopeptidase [Erythrobacter sp. LQ02-29]|uniref:M1 family metallopeptidase n=1 Tax=Erythrobacter sp. LQ02-29 TaxID=2920384 RepID=UPI001F4DDEB1|nr:M1 family metallopeptidase [Erythrobacter sp. LQ02-29]MCP9221660.1 M1 family metallopeptidase [Erythrobacter sp. LQ02-29]
MAVPSLRPFLSALTLVCVATPAAAQYDPQAAFAPFEKDLPVTVYHASDGTPGPQYWQNRADYTINATLHPDATAPTLTGEELITYTNNSPGPLDSLWLQLDQNIYKDRSRAVFAGGGASRGQTDGMVLDRVEVERDGRTVAAKYLVDDTRLQIMLPESLAGDGGTIRVRIAWHFTIPGTWGGRMGWGQVKGGTMYDLAQWYPRMGVYDDVRGWDTAPFIGQEFYLEYGDFDYSVTVPASMIVAGTGELMNPGEVLTKRQQERLAKARTSDATVMIRTPAEVADPASRPQRGGDLTWHFRMANTRDVAFSASPDYAWDAARINLPGGKSSLAMSVYPPQAAGADGWARSTEYLKDTIENFSRRWYPYPWPTAVNVGGAQSGMEYPGLAFDGADTPDTMLFWLTAHELGHSWFPTIVGSDERRHAWMDEGLNTFIDVYESEDFNDGEFAPKRDGEYAPGGGNPVDEILPLLQDADAPPILARTDTIVEKYRHPLTYFKTALGLVLLREEILGPERFDPAFRRYIDAWAYKHPKPADFFRAMESGAGEDLSYFWRGWFANNWALDLGVDAIEAGPDGATTITVGSHDRLVMPATLRVAYADGSQEDIRLPADSWIRNSATAVTIPAGKTLVSATIDPDHKLPDANRANDTAAMGG